MSRASAFVEDELLVVRLEGRRPTVWWVEVVIDITDPKARECVDAECSTAEAVTSALWHHARFREWQQEEQIE